jgi:copper(I)-binding protein
MSIRTLVGMGLFVLAAQALAGEVAVSEASARATAPGQDTAAVGMHIKASRDAKLVGASSPAAKRVEIHVMKHANGMMEMRQVPSLALPANQEVVLGHGTHLMLVGLKHQLKPGARVHLTLTIVFADKHRERVKVVAPVMAVGQDEGMDGHDMGGHSMEGGSMEGGSMGSH